MQRRVYSALRPDHIDRKQDIDHREEKERKHEGRFQRHGTLPLPDARPFPEDFLRKMTEDTLFSSLQKDRMV